MNIPNYSQLNIRSQERLEQAPQSKRLVLIYAAATLGLSLLVTVISGLISLQISRSGGLGNLGTRSMLSTVQSMLPIVQFLIMLCVELGYLSAMLRVSRGQYASPNSLRLGFDRFWVLLRLNILLGLILSGIGFLSLYVGVFIFMLTPFSQTAKALLIPIIQESSLLSSGLVLDDALYDQLARALGPAFVLCGSVFCAVAIPITYRYRMANYIIIDKPALGAMAALRESQQMMRGNRLGLLKLDLRQWPYYLALLAATCVGYADLLLALLGISLPISGTLLYYLCYAGYLAALFAVYYFLRNRVEVCYALAYNALKPQESQDNSVVLGNIFRM